MEPVTLVIPTFNEAETIGTVLAEIPAAYRADMIVADGGSRDGTQEIARAAGARVLDAGRGYGRACAMGAAAAQAESRVIAVRAAATSSRALQHLAKKAIMMETMQSRMSISYVGRRHGLFLNLAF